MEGYREGQEVGVLAQCWACSAWRREDLMGHLGAACQHLQKCYQEDENRIFTEVHGGRMRQNGHKWK